MRIVFVIPPVSKEVLYGEWDLTAIHSISPPIGVLILSSLLKQKGHKVWVIDAYVKSLSINRILNMIKEYQPDVAGISFMTTAFDSALLLAQTIKERFSHVYTIAGGPHVTAIPKETMKKLAFDFGVIGEGEETLPELLETLLYKGDVSKVDSIVFRSANGRIVQTPRRNFIQNMDTIPFPDWTMLNLKNYRLTPIGIRNRYAIPLFTSRGCPNRCAFCDVGALGTQIRGHSVKYVLSMMEEIIKKYGIREFIFYDDTFGALKERDFEICEEIIQRKWGISWSCCTRIDCITKEMLLFMKKAGCWQIQYGIESGCQEILDGVNKNIQLARVKDILRWTRETGIQTRGNFIFGLPGDTEQIIEKTIDFILSLDLDYMQQFFLTPYPGSEIYMYADKLGEFDKDWRKMNDYTINFIPHGMTKETLISLSKKVYRRFYMRRQIVYSHFYWLIRNPVMFFNYFRAFNTFIKTMAR